jgi:pyruvate dehydrogenase E2 component (dihydrolipoamide acetyltransferase)
MLVYTDIVLPNVGFGMEEGRLLAWFKAPGDPVRKGEAVAEVEGDKTTVELEALADGVLDTILVQPDTVVPVGTVLGRIRSGEAAASAAPPTQTAAPSVETAGEKVQASPVARRLAQEQGIDLAAIAGSGPGGRITREDVEAAISQQPTPSRASVAAGRVLAAPAVRRLARDQQIDLKALRGSGPGGRITRADVEAAIAARTQPAPAAQPAPIAQPVAPAPAPAPAAVYGDERTAVSLSTMRRTIARRLAASMQEMPHFYVSGELDFTAALGYLPQGIGINALLLFLTVKALRDVPELNATYEDGQLYHYPHVNLAIAVALPDGLLTPVLRGADDFSLSGLANRSRDLISRAREGKLRPEEMQGGTFTISNLGVIRQIDQFTAIINPPQVGILAVGALKERPVVLNGGLHIRSTAHLTVSADHRIVDGMVSARFIEAFDNHLQAFRG